MKPVSSGRQAHEGPATIRETVKDLEKSETRLAELEARMEVGRTTRRH